jgi:hypothetical protein
MPTRQMTEAELAILYNAIGRAVLHVQYTEDALATHLAITLEVRHLGGTPAAEAAEILAKYRRNTLGSSLHIAKAATSFGLVLQTQLDNFKEERDWLIHRTQQSRKDMYDAEKRDSIIDRIDRIQEEALRLQQAVGAETHAYMVSIGADPQEIERRALQEIRELRGE